MLYDSININEFNIYLRVKIISDTDRFHTIPYNQKSINPYNPVFPGFDDKNESRIKKNHF